jgi:hypothetical protein
MKLCRFAWRFSIGALVMLTTTYPASATRPMIRTTTSTLTVAEKYGNVMLPIGTEVERTDSSIHAATLHSSLTYCHIKFQPGTRLEFGTGFPYSAQLSVQHKVRGINLPKGTEVRFIDNSCNIDSFITHGSDIDFGYAKLNGWIYLYPNGHVKESTMQSAINIRGINAIGNLKFWQNSQLQEFYSGKNQFIKGVPIQANVCIQLDEQGNPHNFVLSKSHQFTNGKFNVNDRVEVDVKGIVTWVYRGQSGRPKTNC